MLPCAISNDSGLACWSAEPNSKPPQSWRFFSLKIGLVRFFHPSAISRTWLAQLHAYVFRPTAYVAGVAGRINYCSYDAHPCSGPESVHNSKPSQVLAASSAHGVSIFLPAASQHQPIPFLTHLPQVDHTSSSPSPLSLTYHRTRTHCR
jgi:hypothetical protein